MPSLDSKSYEPYEFLGWKIKGSDSSEVIPAGNEIDADNIKEDTTFVAVYTQVTVAYKFDYGSLPEARQQSETIDKGGSITLPDLEECGSYKLVGWQVDGGPDEVIPAGTAYEPKENVTLVAVYEEPITLEVPFTTTVKQGGNVAPGKTTFNLQVVDSQGEKISSEDVEVTASITTNGVGDYKGTMTFTGPSQWFYDRFDKGGIFVQQENAGEPDWTYDDTVWCLCPSVVAMASTDDAASENPISIYPTGFEESDDGGRFYYRDLDKNPVKQMTFTNTYTKSITEPKDPTKSNSSANTTKNSKTTKSPNTGDNSNLALWFALLAVSAAGVAGTGVYSKRRRSSRTK